MLSNFDSPKDVEKNKVDDSVDDTDEDVEHTVEDNLMHGLFVCLASRCVRDWEKEEEMMKILYSVNFGWGHFTPSGLDSKQSKTQFQLCKRLARPIFPLSWSRKGVSPSMWLWSPWGRRQPFSCVLGHFWHGDSQPNNWDPSASLLLTSVRKQPFAKCE